MRRTREHTSILQTHDGNLVSSSGPAAVYFGLALKPGEGDHPESFCKRSEWMYDEDHGLRGMNPCFHEVVSTEIPDNRDAGTNAVYRNVNGSWVLGYAFKPRGIASWSNATLIQDAFASVSSVHDRTDDKTWVIPNYVAQAVDAMRPQIVDEMSLLNSIYELKDFRQLPRLVTNTLSSAKGLLDVFGLDFSSLRGKGGLSLRSLIGVGTGHYLNYMFAIAPLLRDIRAFNQALLTAKRGLNSLYARSHKSHVSHWSKELDAAACGVLEVPLSEAVVQRPGEACSYKVSKLCTDVRYTATMRYRFRLPVEMGRLASLLAQLDAFGVNLNPAIIWNAIPFSFVVDWFTNVSSSLDKMKITALPVVVDIMGYCHSIRYTVRTEVRLYPWWQYRLGPEAGRSDPTKVMFAVSDGTLIGRRNRVVYIRNTACPTMFETPKLSDFSTTEKWLSGALIGSIWSSRR